MAFNSMAMTHSWSFSDLSVFLLVVREPIIKNQFQQFHCQRNKLFFQGLPHIRTNPNNQGLFPILILIYSFIFNLVLDSFSIRLFSLYLMLDYHLNFVIEQMRFCKNVLGWYILKSMFLCLKSSAKSSNFDIFLKFELILFCSSGWFPFLFLLLVWFSLFYFQVDDYNL